MFILEEYELPAGTPVRGFTSCDVTIKKIKAKSKKQKAKERTGKKKERNEDRAPERRSVKMAEPYGHRDPTWWGQKHRHSVPPGIYGHLMRVFDLGKSSPRMDSPVPVGNWGVKKGREGRRTRSRLCAPFNCMPARLISPAVVSPTPPFFFPRT